MQFVLELLNKQKLNIYIYKAITCWQSLFLVVQVFTKSRKKICFIIFVYFGRPSQYKNFDVIARPSPGPSGLPGPYTSSVPLCGIIGTHQGVEGDRNTISRSLSNAYQIFASIGKLCFFLVFSSSINYRANKFGYHVL